jgi:hypothetical protein
MIRIKKYNLNPESVALAKDTRHQARRRISTLQAVCNAVDLVKEALPEGSRSEINDQISADFESPYFF